MDQTATKLENVGELRERQDARRAVSFLTGKGGRIVQMNGEKWSAGGNSRSSRSELSSRGKHTYLLSGRLNRCRDCNKSRCGTWDSK